jgi:eukaryotic-like serine/threonine-protein kinase
MSSIIDRYSIVSSLGVGGMAEIFLATRNGPEGFQRVVVLKRVLREFLDDEAFVDMFLDEARLIAKIRHPNVVQVHELGHSTDGLFLAMEYLHGENLRALLGRLSDRKLHLDPALAAVIVSEAASGLHAAHELTDGKGRPQRVVHRDVSPENLFVTYDGDVKVIDFGIAKTKQNRTQTQPGNVKGKAAYMSPEQVMGGAIDRRTDVFALGVVLWELLTGQRLFRRRTMADTWSAVLSYDIPLVRRFSPQCPVELETACSMALARDPNERYQTADALRRDLVAWVMRSGLEQLPRDTLATLMQTLFSNERQARERTLNESSVQVSARSVTLDKPSVVLPSDRKTTSDSDTTSDKTLPVPMKLALPVQVPSTQGSSVPRTGSRRWTLGAVGGLFVALSAFAGYRLAPRRLPAAPTRQVTPHASAEAPTPSPVIAASAALPRHALVHVESEPSGAQLYLDGRSRGATPLDLELPLGDNPIAIELQLSGYRSMSKTITPDGDHSVTFPLKREAQKSRRAQREDSDEPSYPRFE